MHNLFQRKLQSQSEVRRADSSNPESSVSSRRSDFEFEDSSTLKTSSKERTNEVKFQIPFDSPLQLKQQSNHIYAFTSSNNKENQYPPSHFFYRPSIKNSISSETSIQINNDCVNQKEKSDSTSQSSFNQNQISENESDFTLLFTQEFKNKGTQKPLQQRSNNNFQIPQQMRQNQQIGESIGQPAVCRSALENQILSSENQSVMNPRVYATTTNNLGNPYQQRVSLVQQEYQIQQKQLKEDKIETPFTSSISLNKQDEKSNSTSSLPKETSLHSQYYSIPTSWKSDSSVSSSNFSIESSIHQAMRSLYPLTQCLSLNQFEQGEEIEKGNQKSQKARIENIHDSFHGQQHGVSTSQKVSTPRACINLIEKQLGKSPINTNSRSSSKSNCESSIRNQSPSILHSKIVKRVEKSVSSPSPKTPFLKRKSNLEIQIGSETSLSIANTAHGTAKSSQGSSPKYRNSGIFINFSHPETNKFMQKHFNGGRVAVIIDNFVEVLMKEYSNLLSQHDLENSLKAELKQKLISLLGGNHQKLNAGTGKISELLNLQRLEELTFNNGLLGFILNGLQNLAIDNPQITNASSTDSISSILDSKATSSKGSILTFLGDRSQNQIQFKGSDLQNIKNILQEFMESLYREMEREIYAKFSVEMRRLTTKFQETEQLLKQVTRIVDDNFGVISKQQSMAVRLRAEEQKNNLLQKYILEKEIEIKLLNDSLRLLSEENSKITEENDKLQNKYENYLHNSIRNLQSLRENTLKEEYLNFISTQKAGFDACVAEIKDYKSLRSSQKVFLTPVSQKYVHSVSDSFIETLDSLFEQIVEQNNNYESDSFRVENRVVNFLQDLCPLIKQKTKELSEDQINNCLKYTYISQIQLFQVDIKEKRYLIQKANQNQRLKLSRELLQNGFDLFSDILQIIPKQKKMTISNQMYGYLNLILISRGLGNIEIGITGFIQIVIDNISDKQVQSIVSDGDSVDIILNLITQGSFSNDLIIEKCLSFFTFIFKRNLVNNLKKESNLKLLFEVMQSSFNLVNLTKSLLLIKELVNNLEIAYEKSEKVMQILEIISVRRFGVSRKGAEANEINAIICEIKNKLTSQIKYKLKK